MLPNILSTWATFLLDNKKGTKGLKGSMGIRKGCLRNIEYSKKRLVIKSMKWVVAQRFSILYLLYSFHLLYLLIYTEPIIKSIQKSLFSTILDHHSLVVLYTRYRFGLSFQFWFLHKLSILLNFVRLVHSTQTKHYLK